jgi:hypothetical protein
MASESTNAAVEMIPQVSINFHENAACHVTINVMHPVPTAAPVSADKQQQVAETLFSLKADGGAEDCDDDEEEEEEESQS